MESFIKQSIFTDSQVISILKASEAGAKVADLCREHGMSQAKFYKWHSKFGGMDVSMMKRLKELEAENVRLKKMHAEERLKAELAREVIEKSCNASQPPYSNQTVENSARSQHSALLFSGRY